MHGELPTTLVYYSYRGLAHPVRMFLTFLQVPFYNVHFDQLDKQASGIPVQVIEGVKAKEVDEKRLPLLIHEGRQIYTTYEIMDYLCLRFERQELLGKTMQQRAVVEQITDLYRVMFQEKLPEMLTSLQRLAQIPDHSILQGLEQVFKKLFFELGVARNIQSYREKNPDKSQFIFGNLTVIDFFFFDTNFYILGQYSALCPQLANEKWKECTSNYRASSHTVQTLLQLKEYNDHFKAQEWYKNHKHDLQKYPILGPLTEKQREAYKKMWGGDLDVLK